MKITKLELQEQVNDLNKKLKNVSDKCKINIDY